VFLDDRSRQLLAFVARAEYVANQSLLVDALQRRWTTDQQRNRTQQTSSPARDPRRVLAAVYRRAEFGWKRPFVIVSPLMGMHGTRRLGTENAKT